MRIITISRQFGSGGRELGKRLAERLGWDYYDKEIIRALADEHAQKQGQVKALLSNHGWSNVPLTYRNTFSTLVYNPGLNTQLLTQERDVIREIAALGNDCVIVGRDADVILEDYRPFRIYACADLQSRLDRCMKHELKRPKEDQLTQREIERNIRGIDRNRATTREILTGKNRGDGSAFDLTVNTASWEIKKLTAALGDFALQWFE